MDCDVQVDQNMIILNHDGKYNAKHDVLYFIILFTKQYIYRTRCQGKLINITSVINEIKMARSTEKYIAAVENKLTKHYKRWSPVNIFKTILVLCCTLFK